MATQIHLKYIYIWFIFHYYVTLPALLECTSKKKNNIQNAPPPKKHDGLYVDVFPLPFGGGRFQVPLTKFYGSTVLPVQELFEAPPWEVGRSEGEDCPKIPCLVSEERPRKNFVACQM